MENIKDYAQIAAYIFLAGGAWSMVKFLKESVTEIKATLKETTGILNAHETRITVLESKAGKK